MNTQFKKGVLKLCVLDLLKKQECYGYEIVKVISDSVHVSEGTIYPLLRNLKEEGLVSTYLKDSSEGPSRKYYKLTSEGEKVQAQIKEDWTEFSYEINKFLNIKQ